MKSILLIIQARMGSSRLPGKVLKVLNGKPLILQLISELKKSLYDLDIIVATSKNPENDQLVETLKQNGIKSFRGSEDDVLSRFISLVEINQPDIIVRATADDPLMSAKCMDLMIDYLIQNKLDYTFMKNMPLGTSVEVVNADVFVRLKECNNLSDYDREHVTPYIKEHPEQFKVGYMEAIDEYSYPELSFTIDTQEEFDRISRMYDEYGDCLDLDKAIECVKNGQN